jgi:hypothetical protein
MAARNGLPGTRETVSFVIYFSQADHRWQILYPAKVGEPEPSSYSVELLSRSDGIRMRGPVRLFLLDSRDQASG